MPRHAPARIPLRCSVRSIVVNTIIIVAALVILGGLVGWRVLRKSDASSSSPIPKEDKKKSKVMTPEQTALYELGLHPAEDGTPVMYALETCRHCRKTREFLDENKVSYHLIYVDQFSGEVRSSLMDKVRSYNPRGSFPTIVIPGGKVVVGFREQLLREALLHDSGSVA